MQHGKILLRNLDTIMERLGTRISYLILVMMSVTVYEVAARYAFNRPTFWAHETAELVLCVYIMLGAGFTLCHQASPKHIKMDIFYTRFSPRKKAIVELVGFITFFLFLGVVVWQGWGMAWRSLQMWEHSPSVWSPPLYPIKFSVPVGAFLMVVMGVARFIRNLNTAITGKEAA